MAWSGGSETSKLELCYGGGSESILLIERERHEHFQELGGMVAA